jgi:CspA family cold shock protein
MKGTVKWFNGMKGYGFIAGDDGKEYFVHQSGITPGNLLKDGTPVQFETEQGEKGPKAVKVSVAEAGSEPEAPSEETSEEATEETTEEAAE